MSFAGKPPPPGEFIVKVQIDATGKSVLTYNEDRSVLFEGLVDDGVRRLMGRARKRFAWATLQDTVIHIDRRAPEQDW